MVEVCAGISMMGVRIYFVISDEQVSSLHTSHPTFFIFLLIQDQRCMADLPITKELIGLKIPYGAWEAGRYNF